MFGFFTKSFLAAPQQGAEIPLPPPRSKLCSVEVSDVCHSYLLIRWWEFVVGTSCSSTASFVCCFGLLFNPFKSYLTLGSLSHNLPVLAAVVQKRR